MAIAAALWLALVAVSPGGEPLSVSVLKAVRDTSQHGEQHAAHTPSRALLRPIALNETAELKRRHHPHEPAPSKNASAQKPVLAPTTDAADDDQRRLPLLAPSRSPPIANNDAHRPRAPPVLA